MRRDPLATKSARESLKPAGARCALWSVLIRRSCLGATCVSRAIECFERTGSPNFAPFNDGGTRRRRAKGHCQAAEEHVLLTGMEVPVVKAPGDGVSRKGHFDHVEAREFEDSNSLRVHRVEITDGRRRNDP